MSSPDLTACDREPIHVPGAIQPHGLLLALDGDQNAVAGAGDIQDVLGVGDWLGKSATELLGLEIVEALPAASAARSGAACIGVLRGPSGALFDVSAQRSGDLTMVELEPAGPDGARLGVVLGDLEAAASEFERASTVEQLCGFAAAEFRRLTGFDRVMIYQFLDDDSGSVVGEDRREGLRSFLNHRFPASDIPRQARALYLRNPIRVIPDVDYTPAPLQPATLGGEPIDLSDVALRSVSPIHLQYLRNMGVRASASVSIVKDGVLWGLVACHNETPLHIPFARRAACRALAGMLGRQIRAKDESDAFRERVRLRGFQDDLVALLSREGSLDAAISNHVAEIRRALGGDGVAILRGGDLLTNGRCPAEEQIRALAAWALNRSADQVFSTARLAELLPDAAAYRHAASGLLAITLSLSEPWIVMWFRAEEIEVVEWAGNPHKDVAKGPEEALTPRASFESWRETVRGRARRWTGPEIEAAGRLRAAVTEVWQSRRLRDLNRRLVAALDEKDLLIQQKDFLVGEVNHRVQNSLQLVSSFLALQARASDQPGLAPALDEARRRLTAVALVHRRLYRADQVRSVDAARYVEELVHDIAASIGEDWARQMSLDVAPVLVPTDRAISLGLVLTELVINATKYAYGGSAGPLAISLVEDRARLRLSVADQGVGAQEQSKQGFGTRMIAALVRQLEGELVQEDNRPGLRVTLVAPVAADAALAPHGV